MTEKCGSLERSVFSRFPSALSGGLGAQVWSARSYYPSPEQPRTHSFYPSMAEGKLSLSRQTFQTNTLENETSFGACQT